MLLAIKFFDNSSLSDNVFKLKLIGCRMLREMGIYLLMVVILRLTAEELTLMRWVNASVGKHVDYILYRIVDFFRINWIMAGFYGDF